MSYYISVNAINYDKKMLKQISALDGKRSLLLHACCAPCSTACLEKLVDSFDVTVLFYNPNIAGDEYDKRKNELIKYIKQTGCAQFLDCDRDEQAYYEAIKGLENCKEGGERCFKCFELRLRKCALLAKRLSFDFFTTTLTVSPRKDARKINLIGEKISAEVGVSWLYCDFKKRGGSDRSFILTEKYNLYKQNYCGCIFSLKSLDNPEK